MILINVRFPIRADKQAQWEELSAAYAASVNAEPGCLFFEFARSTAEPGTYVCIEGYTGHEAGVAHTQTDHFAEFIAAMPGIVSARPQIIYIDAEEATGFGPMGEIEPR